jgi:glycosyltransferase involved in cell wall biosynthesis
VDEVLIDVTRLLSRLMEGRLPTGVDRVSLAYVQHFADRATALVRYAGRWVELGKDDSLRLFDGLVAPNEHMRSLIRWCVGRSYALRWRNKAGARVLLNTGHSGLNLDSYALRVRQINHVHKQRQKRQFHATPMGRRGLQPVFFLHDIIPITHPEYCRPGEAEKHHRRLETMVSIGRGLIVNSAATRSELQSYAEKVGWRLPPCVVAPLAPTPLPPPAALRPLAEPYFVILGTIESRKNHLLLLNLWRQLAEEMGKAAPRLVVIGQRGWESEQVADMLERCAVLHPYVIEESRCTDEQLATWLHHAQALLFPSFAEGFGMPLVEGLSMGLPVIASDLPVFREIGGDIPEYLDPLDGPGWKRAVVDYMQNDSARHRNQRERMKGYAAPTWENHFGLVETFMNALIDKAC